MTASVLRLLSPVLNPTVPFIGVLDRHLSRVSEFCRDVSAKLCGHRWPWSRAHRSHYAPFRCPIGVTLLDALTNQSEKEQKHKDPKNPSTPCITATKKRHIEKRLCVVASAKWACSVIAIIDMPHMITVSTHPAPAQSSHPNFSCSVCLSICFPTGEAAFSQGRPACSRS